MSKSLVEYRVVPVTRFIVTRYETTAPPKGVGTSEECCEVESYGKANAIADAMASRDRHDSANVEVRVVPFEQPPGRAMRFKLKLSGRLVALASATGEDGKPLGRTITRGEGPNAYTAADPTDPANFRGDGEKLTFHAVMASFNSAGENACEENRIFGLWSPQVTFDAVVRNPDVLDRLTSLNDQGGMGEEFYVDFIHAPKS